MIRFIIPSIALVLGLIWFLNKPNLPEHQFKNTKALTTVNHSEWNILLKKYVDNQGNVNYKAFQKDSEQLANYLKYLSENTPTKDWSQAEGLAYYINLYNAGTVQLILENYPLNSIKDISSPWGQDRVLIGTEKYSLGDIEHKILRKMNEPRIHFAINCASYSCPKLENEAFIASKIENQLETATKSFINDPKRNIIAENQLQLSNIFKWYKKDFTDNSSLTAYINPYTKVAIAPKADIDYLKYDWSLNESK